MDNKKDTIIPSHILRDISKALAGLSYGEVSITVHDGRIVQIERKEKKRY
ncbi:YezD family protein [Chitinivibrio alkaliphilus]|uniref:DUF2292 domain-containing protein n=1 Tax=Chitinivibrio alkaliphilus ACht1 TaxID=1313304 RepID=U7D5J6_9BACT|nr:DUF2292 domain-containing protein [Chitinivibrio alkaliphilus]ERP31238.1 hypothetical protein CALK_1855 [Chitinivibrio alkaliphilus ACht1]